MHNDAHLCFGYCVLSGGLVQCVETQTVFQNALQNIRTRKSMNGALDVYLHSGNAGTVQSSSDICDDVVLFDLLAS